MKKYIFTLFLLMVSNTQTSAHLQDDSDMKPSVTQIRKNHAIALASSVALGCLSGYFCAKLYPTLGKTIENDIANVIADAYWDSNGEKWISDLYWKNGQRNIALVIYLVLWSIPESIATSYLIDELKQLKIDHNSKLLRFGCSASSWLTFLLTVK